MTRSLVQRGVLVGLASAVAASAWSMLLTLRSVEYDGADWHLKGEGVVFCPCAVPCPCRTNGPVSYGHCEATLYLHIKEGHYAAPSLKGLNVVDTGGACAMSYERLSALYFDRSAATEQRSAFMKLVSSFSRRKTADFPYVRTVPIKARIIGGHRVAVVIPEILNMEVDLNWGRARPPIAMSAGADPFSNLLRYAENLSYQLHDPEAKLDFDYSHRQANYREIDLDVNFSTGRGRC